MNCLALMRYVIFPVILSNLHTHKKNTKTMHGTRMLMYIVFDANPKYNKGFHFGTSSFLASLHLLHIHECTLI